MWGYELNESFLDNGFLQNFALNLRLLSNHDKIISCKLFFSIVGNVKEKMALTLSPNAEMTLTHFSVHQRSRFSSAVVTPITYNKMSVREDAHTELNLLNVLFWQ